MEYFLVFPRVFVGVLLLKMDTDLLLLRVRQDMIKVDAVGPSLHWYQEQFTGNPYS